jgi:hypothetical protein
MGQKGIVFAIGIIRAFGSGQGDGMQLIAKHDLLSGGPAARIARLFFERFQAADGRLQITDGNL